MIRTPIIIAFFLSYYVDIRIAQSCFRVSKDDDKDVCGGASNRMEFRILTGTAIAEEFFYTITNEKIVFYVKTSNYANIFLNTLPIDKLPLLKITIGRNRNRKSTIKEYKKNHSIHSLPLITTPDILNARRFCGFWISLHDKIVAVGRENEEKPFMIYTSNIVTKLSFISFSTPLVETGEWIITSGIMQDTRTGWCGRSRTVQPSCDAVKVNVSNDKQVYICRSVFKGHLIPGYAKRPNGHCRFEHFGVHKSKNYQLLLGDTPNWQTVDKKMIPAKAAVGGLTDEHKPLFICRFKYNNKMIIGNTNNDGRCWAVSDGISHHSYNYDILIENIPFTYIKSTSL